jgi:putative FmdB family regulatory protein
VPLYEYRCKECDRRFDLRRAVPEADAPAECPDGHADAVRLLAAFAAVGRASSPSAPLPAGGCGANCACAHGA